MSVRTEPRDLSAQLQQTLTIPAEVMAAQNPQMMVPTQTAAGMEGAMVAQGPTDTQLHEANSFNTNNEHHPLERTVCINIRASLSDLCLRSNTATWAPPSAEATKAIFQQARPEPATRTALSAPTAPRQPRQRQRRRPGTTQGSRLLLLPPPTRQPATPREPHTAPTAPRVGGVRSASSSTWAAPPRTRATSRAWSCTR
jgi:hypothetical protein